MMNLKSILFILLLLFLSAKLSAQIDYDQKFSEALKLFSEKNYHSALVLFQQISDKENKKRTVAEFFVVKTLIELNRFSDAEKIALNFLERFSESKYTDEVSVLLIKSCLGQKKYKSAFKYAVELIKSTKSTSYKIEGKSIAGAIAKNYLSSYDLKNFAEEETDKKIKAFILFTLAELYSIESEYLKAENTLKEIIEDYSQTDEYFLAKNYKSGTNIANKSAENVIAVILPLTNSDGAVNNVAIEMLEGIKYAFHEFNLERDNKIGLLVRDSKRNKNRIENIIDEINSNDNIKAVIGPVYSDESEIVVSALNKTDLIFISPTATDEDLTENNDQFYQANPPFTVRGKVFAQYVYLKEGKKNFAILNSLDGYSPILAKSFADEFQRLGGNILVKETYRSKSIDLSRQISNLIPHLGKLDGIYIPLSDRNDAEIILSEMLKQNIIIPVYGNQDWLSAKGLETSSTISNTLKITSDYFIDFNEKSFIDFNSEFLNTTGREITRNVLYGYDTARFLTTVLRSIQPSRNIIKLKIDSGLKSFGYHNNISFSKKKRNLYLNILGYSNSKFFLIEKYRGTE